MQKVNAITKGKSDIIFMCDMRLNSYHQSFAIHDLEKKFTSKGYDLFHNSKRSNRGVGILISKKIPYTINRTLVDYDDNYILVDIVVLQYRMIIGSVYGPNTNNSNFYENLNTDIKSLNCDTVILGEIGTLLGTIQPRAIIWM